MVHQVNAVNRVYKVYSLVKVLNKICEGLSMVNITNTRHNPES